MKINAISVIALSAILALCALWMNGNKESKLGGLDYNRLTSFTQATTSIGMYAINKSTLLAADSGRQWVSITHLSPATCYIHFGDASSTAADMPLYGTTTFVMDETNMYRGVITALCSATTTFYYTIGQ
jgi:hypothetical protein